MDKPNLTFEMLKNLHKMMGDIPKPSPWQTGPIYVIGQAGNVYRFIYELERLTPPLDPALPNSIFAHAGPQIIPSCINNGDPDFIMLMAGREFAKVYMISLGEFLKRWKQDGEDLAELIKRLESHQS